MIPDKKLFIDPFIGVVKVVTPKDEAWLSTVNKKFEELPTIDEFVVFLNGMYHTCSCFGKFAMYNKWLYPKLPEETAIPKKQRTVVDAKLHSVFMKCNTKCSRCKLYDKCIEVDLEREELSVLWFNLYIEQGKNFFERRF